MNLSSVDLAAWLSWSDFWYSCQFGQVACWKSQTIYCPWFGAKKTTSHPLTLPINRLYSPLDLGGWPIYLADKIPFATLFSIFIKLWKFLSHTLSNIVPGRFQLIFNVLCHNNNEILVFLHNGKDTSLDQLLLFTERI